MLGRDGSDDRIIELVNRLVRRTNHGLADWRPAGGEGRYIYAARSGAVTLDVGTSSVLASVAGTISLTVHDPSGNEVGSLSAPLPGTLGSAIRTGSGQVAQATLRELASAVQTYVERKSQVIDQLIAEIG